MDAFFLHFVAAFTGCVPNGLVTTISTSAEINSTLEAIKMYGKHFFDWNLQAAVQKNHLERKTLFGNQIIKAT